MIFLSLLRRHVTPWDNATVIEVINRLTVTSRGTVAANIVDLSRLTMVGIKN